MNTLKKIMLATALGLLASVANAASTDAKSATPDSSSAVTTASAPDISGTYKCTYQDPASTPPNGSESIVFKKNGDTYSVKMIAAGDTFPYDYGTAIFNKNINDAFALINWKVKDITSFASETFIIKPDGSLDAAYVSSGYKMATETCTKSS